MRTIVCVASSLIMSLVLPPSDARAQQKCADLPGNQQAKCNQEVARQCAGVTGYWPKRRCEEKVAGSLDTCSSQESVKACQQLRRDYEQVCRLLNEHFTGSGEARWLAAIKSLPEVLRRARAYEPVIKDCGRKVSSCSYGPREHADCMGAGEAAKKSWATHLSWFRGEGLKPEWGRIEDYKNSKSFADAAATCERMISGIEKKLELNKTPEIKTDASALQADLDKLKKMKAELGKAAEAEVAKVKCPAKGKGGGKWAAQILEHFAKHNPNVKETIKRFGFVGGVTKTYHGIAKNIVREHKDGVACVHRVNENKQEDCYYIYAHFSRQKHVAEKRWGDWIIERFSGNETMLCKNLR